MKSRRIDFTNYWLSDDRSALIVSLTIAAVIWLLVKLSKDGFMTERRIFVEFVLPADKLLVTPLPKYFVVKVRGRGFDILSDYFSKNQKKIRFDLADEKNQLTSSIELKEKIRVLLMSQNLYLESFVTNEPVNIQLEKASSKMLPVRLVSNISFAPNYQLVDSILVEPKQIKVAGVHSIINQLTDIQTNILEIKNIEAYQTVVKLPLKHPNNAQVFFSPDTVNVTIKADKFTERTLAVSIKAINNKDSIMIFPNNAMVTFRVSLSNFEKATQNDFRVEADFSKADALGNTLPLQLKKWPLYATDLSIRPKAVEYFILKQRNKLQK